MEEELNKEEENEKEENDIIEVEEAAGPSQEPKQPEKSKIQPKIDSFFTKNNEFKINLSNF